MWLDRMRCALAIGRRGGLTPASLGSLNPEWIGVPVILTTQLSEENITSGLGAAKIERYGQLGLIADNTGVSSGIGDAIRAFATRYDDNRVLSGFAETGKDQIDVQQCRGKVERRFWGLLFGTAKGPIVREIERSIKNGGCLLASGWIRHDRRLPIPVFGNYKPDNEASSAQRRDGSDARR